MPALFFYISGHGFGHASRDIEVVNTLGAERPDIPIVIRTAASRRLLDATLRVPVTLIEGECDTGVVQIDSLRFDAAATIDKAARFYRSLDERANADAELLRRHDARLVISDAPPLACAAAARAGVPSVVLANFTWDWIYRWYPRELESAPGLIGIIEDAYRSAEEGWRLPLDGGFETIGKIVDVPFVIRRGRTDLTSAAVRRMLDLPEGRPLVLVSFGGYGVRGVPYASLDCLDEFTVVLAEQASDISGLPSPVIGIDERRLGTLGLGYEDLVRAVDVAITKPGYGIVADCLAGDTAMLYTSRGRFPEYDVMIRGMPQLLRCAFIEQHDLLAGRWREALRRVLSLPPAPARPRLDGAAVVVGMIGERI